MEDRGPSSTAASPIIERHILDQVDLAIYPPDIRKHAPYSTIKTGDLDGSAIKFLYYLVAESVVTLPEEKYHQFYRLYNLSPENWTRENIDELNEILSAMQKSDMPIAIQVGGDDVCDRGTNDLMMFKMFERLDQLGVPFNDILVSNHGMEFLFQYLTGLDKENITYYYRAKQPEYGRSLIGLQTLIKNGVVSLAEVESLIQHHYLPKLKFAVCEESTLPQAQGLDVTLYLLFTHAPVNGEKMQALAKQLGIDTPNDDLFRFVEQLNQKLQAILSLPSKQLATKFLRLPEIEKWVNDRYEDLVPGREVDIPYQVLNLHGHVGQGAQPKFEVSGWQHFNLDTWLQKVIKGAFVTKGYYIAYVSLMDPSLVKQLRRQEEKQAAPKTEKVSQSDLWKSKGDKKSNADIPEEGKANRPKKDK